MKKATSLFASWILITFVLSGQDISSVDSLKTALKSAGSDSSRIKIYQLLSLATTHDLATAVRYEEQALALAYALKDRQRISGCLTNIGVLYKNQSEYRKGIPYFKKSVAEAEGPTSPYLASTFFELGIAYLRITELDSSRNALIAGLEIAKKSANRNIEAGIYNALGNVYKDENNFKAAVEYYLKATELFQHEHNDAGLTQALSNIGNVENLMGNYEKALRYAQQSLDIARSIQKKSSIAYSNRLLGRIYRKMGKYPEALKVYDAAIETYESMNARRDAGETYLNKGNIYYEMEAFPRAIEQYLQSLKIVRSISDTANMVYAYSALGMAYDEMNKHALAFSYLDSAQIYSQKLGMLHITLDTHLALAELHAEHGNFRAAYDHQLLYTDLHDSLQTVRNAEDAKELETRYEAAQKEQEIRTLNAQNDLKALQLAKSNEARNYLIGFILLCLLLIGVIYSRYRIKQKTAQKLEELDEMKSRFFANISHEFRTPLSLILGPLQQKIRDSENKKERDELELMERNARRLQTLINQLLDLSKLEAGHMNLNVSKENVRHLLAVVLSSFTSIAEYRGISCTYSIDNHVNEGFLDRDKIEKIVYNLVSNAFKFTDVGGRVDVTVKQNHNRIVIEVRDSGVGISEAALPRIFDRFFQADDALTRAGEGTGIGLALSKELAALHRGTLTVASKAGEGSCFTLTFPYHRSDYQPGEIAVSNGSPIATALPPHSQQDGESFSKASDHSLPLVLIAEDHPDMSRFIANTLEDDYRVMVAKDGEEGWKRSLELIPDIVISDLMMPKLDGRQLCQRIKTHEATSHIPVIILTARADQPSKIQGLETGADDYLTKPFDAQELQVRVANLLDLRRKLRTLFRQEIVLAPKQLQLASPDTDFLNKVLTILEANYSNAVFGVEEFTAEVGLSRMQLHRKLKSLTDKSPGEFIRQYRLEMAKQLLRVKGISVGDVSYRIGFNNPSNFAKVFKEYTGITPSEFATEHATEIPQKQP